MGHSMGGYGSNNLATHHPDLFAAVAPAQGTDSIDAGRQPAPRAVVRDDVGGGPRRLRDRGEGMYGALSERGYDATLLDYTLKIHEYSSIYDSLPGCSPSSPPTAACVDPAVVTWVRPTGEDRPELGLVYDGAYWVDGVRATDERGARRGDRRVAGRAARDLRTPRRRRAPTAASTRAARPAGRRRSCCRRSLPPAPPCRPRTRSAWTRRTPRRSPWTRRARRLAGADAVDAADGLRPHGRRRRAGPAGAAARHVRGLRRRSAGRDDHGARRR